MWKITEHKCLDTLIELNVKTVVKDLAERDYITWSVSFEENFKERLRYIPKRNGISPEICYQIISNGFKQVEIWKTSPAGDKKYKMFTLDYIPDVGVAE